MRPSLPRFLALVAPAALAALVAACGATPTSTTAPSGTFPAAATQTSRPVSSQTAAATPEQTPGPSPSPTPFPFAAIDGLTCAGTWTNATFGSSGPISITFALQRDAAVVLDVGGPVFGSSGGHLVLPVTTTGSTFHIAGAFGFLGTLTVSVGADGTTSAVLDQPPALGTGFRVTVTKFVLAAGALSIESTTTLSGTTIAQATVSARCTKAS